MRNLPHVIKTSKIELREKEKWCAENFGVRWEAIGRRDGKWTYFWDGWGNNYRFHFMDSESAVLFALMWSS